MPPSTGQAETPSKPSSARSSLGVATRSPPLRALDRLLGISKWRGEAPRIAAGVAGQGAGIVMVALVASIAGCRRCAPDPLEWKRLRHPLRSAEATEGALQR